MRTTMATFLSRCRLYIKRQHERDVYANFPSELLSKPWQTTSGSAAKRAISNPRLPRVERTRHDPERLYPLEVLERDGPRVKVHYVGYSSTHDEWRDIEEIVTPESEEQQTEKC